MTNIISKTVAGLLGQLGELRLYNRKETDALILEAKVLEEAVDPTIEHLRTQGKMLRANADITVARLENVAVQAEATTKVAVAAANALETVVEQAEIYAAAEQRVRTIAANVTPAYAALLSGKSVNTTAPQLPGDSQQSFLQLPHRR